MTIYESFIRPVRVMADNETEAKALILSEIAKAYPDSIVVKKIDKTNSEEKK